VTTLEAPAGGPPHGLPTLGASGKRVGRSRAGDSVFRGFTVLCAAILAALMAAMFIVLVFNSRVSFKHFGLSFLWSRAWDTEHLHFGALTAIYGTLFTTVIAMVIAVPLALAIALLLVELAPPSVSRVVGTAIELLAAVPSIVFGMWGFAVIVPFMSNHFEPWVQSTWLGKLSIFQGPALGQGFLTAGIVLALMVLPFITAVTRDVLRMVPQVVKEAGHGMGSTTWEVTRKVSMRYGLSGIVGAMFIGLGRALGETMAVAFLIGQTYDTQHSLFGTGNTIASTLANTFTEASDPLTRSSLIELGLVLLIITVLLQLVAHLWLRRVRNAVGTRA
jgi:phosphate transport system permease protein